MRSYREIQRRLARLEAQAAAEWQEAEEHSGPLTVEDGIALVWQVGLGNVVLVDGRAVRKWDTNDNQLIDAAIARLNAELAATPNAITETWELAGVLRARLGSVDEDTLPGYVWAAMWKKYGDQLEAHYAQLS